MQLQQHNIICGLNKHRDVETGVSSTNTGFKRNLPQSTGRYDKILVHLYVLLNRASITEPFSATCVLDLSAFRTSLGLLSNGIVFLLLIQYSFLLSR